MKYLLPKFGDRKFDFDNRAHTCLHKAAREGYPKILRFLIEEHGFDPSLRDLVQLFADTYIFLKDKGARTFIVDMTMSTCYAFSLKLPIMKLRCGHY